jgi:hypothetical protein
VSFNFCQGQWDISAVFPNEDGRSEDFVFKGDFESDETFAAPEPFEESSNGIEDASDGEESDVCIPSQLG